MFIGISKSLGAGVRIGVGKRISFSSPTERGPTQRELAKAEKEDFLKKIAENANDVINSFYVNENLLPEELNKGKINVHNLLKGSNSLERYDKLESLIEEIQEILKKIQFGGSLTAKRKDKMVDLIFEAEKCVGTGPGLNVIAKQISREVFLFRIFTPVIPYLIMTYGATYNQEKLVPLPDVFFYPFYGFIAGFSFLVLWKLIGLYGSIKYRLKGRKIMKKVYGLR